MLVGVAAFQHSPSVETVPLPRSQVCIRKVSSSCSFKVCLCRFIDPFTRFTHRAPSLSRAEFLTHRCQAESTPSSLKFQAVRSFHRETQRHDLQSLKEAIKQQSSLDDSLHSYDGSPSQDLQRLKGFLNQHAEAQPNRNGGLEQQRLPKAATGVLNYSKTEPVQDYPARNQPGTQSSAASSGSPQPGSTYKNRDARPSKHRGRRIPARGFDALDKLMASQGHTSRALLESLQSTVASDDDSMPGAHFHGKHTLKEQSEGIASNSFYGKVSRTEISEKVRSEKVRASIDTWRPSYDTTTGNAATSSTFASSIEKALSPSTASSTTRSALASSTSVRVLEQNMTSSNPAEDSDVAKPSLRGHEVLLAIQKAAMEKAKLKQRTRKVSDRTSKSKQVVSQYDSGEWRDAKPIIVKPEWAYQIDEIERRIENLKNPISSL